MEITLIRDMKRGRYYLLAEGEPDTMLSRAEIKIPVGEPVELRWESGAPFSSVFAWCQGVGIKPNKFRSIMED